MEIPEKGNRRHYGIGERESKVESSVWLERERQLVTVGNTVLAPISNPLDPAGCVRPLHFSRKLLCGSS